ncbi:hypothetical protein D3C76_1691670 [compost metagenome]
MLRTSMPWPGSTLITLPLPRFNTVLTMSTALEFVVPAVRLRLAPRRWVRTPLIASSWYSCGVQRCNASAASAPLPVLNACSPKRYTGIVTSTRVPSARVRPSLPVMS